MKNAPRVIAAHYKDALDAGLFGVKLDEESGHHSEEDVRKELEKLLEEK
jgi:hypothetical protein